MRCYIYAGVETQGFQTKEREITYSIEAEAVGDAEWVADAEGPAIARTLLLTPKMSPELLDHVAGRRCKFDRKNSLIDSHNSIRPIFPILESLLADIPCPTYPSLGNTTWTDPDCWLDEACTSGEAMPASCWSAPCTNQRLKSSAPVPSSGCRCQIKRDCWPANVVDWSVRLKEATLWSWSKQKKLIEFK